MIDAGSFTPPYDHALCEALTARGVDVLLARAPYTAGPWDQPTYRTWNEFHRRSQSPAARRFPKRSRQLLKAAEHFGDLNRLVSRLQEDQPSVIHFQWLPLPMLDLMALHRLQSIAPLVLTLHDTTLFHGAPSSVFQGLGLQRAIRKFDRIIVHTEFSRQRAERTGLARPEQLVVIPHGPFSFYKALGSAIKPDADRLTILFFGSIKPYKGLDLLIEALSYLPPSIRQRTRLLIAGEPSISMEPLRQAAARFGVEGMIDWRLGFIPENAVGPLFEAASVVALPYREIDQSGVLLTAAAFAKTVVATRVGGVPEMLGSSGERGVLADSVTPRAIGAALTKALEDERLRHDLGEALRSWCDMHHSWQSAAQLTEATYSDLQRTPS